MRARVAAVAVTLLAAVGFHCERVLASSTNNNTCAACTADGGWWCDTYCIGECTSNCAASAAVARASLCVNRGVWHTQPKGCARLPKVFDARHQWPQCVTQINNQGTCGNCFAWSTLGAVGDRICIANALNPVNLSPQRFTSCGDLGGCEGGYPRYVLARMTQSNETAMCAPTCSTECAEAGINAGCAGGCSRYENATDHCPESGPGSAEGCYTCPATCDDGSSFLPPTAGFRSGGDVDDAWTHTLAPTTAANCHYIATSRPITRDDAAMANNDRAVQTELLQNGPVSASYGFCDDFDAFFRDTPDGVYDGCNCSTSDNVTASHAIKIVGWGQSASGVPYWLCANSWGRDWPDNSDRCNSTQCAFASNNCGYFRMAMGISCGINSPGHIVYAGYPLQYATTLPQPAVVAAEAEVQSGAPFPEAPAPGAAVEIPLDSALAIEALHALYDGVEALSVTDAFRDVRSHHSEPNVPAAYYRRQLPLKALFAGAQPFHATMQVVRGVRVTLRLLARRAVGRRGRRPVRRERGGRSAPELVGSLLRDPGGDGRWRVERLLRCSRAGDHHSMPSQCTQIAGERDRR